MEVKENPVDSNKVKQTISIEEEYKKYVNIIKKLMQDEQQQALQLEQTRKLVEQARGVLNFLEQQLPKNK